MKLISKLLNFIISLFRKKSPEETELEKRKEELEEKLEEIEKKEEELETEKKTDKEVVDYWKENE